MSYTRLGYVTYSKILKRMEGSAGKSWTVVQFLQDNSVAAVPTIWVQEDRCLWPPFPSSKLSLAIKNQTMDTSWPSYDIKIFRNATYDNYEKARAKAKQAEETSDLGTDFDDQCNEKKNRKVIKKKRPLSSEDESDENTPLRKLPTPPILRPAPSEKQTIRKTGTPKRTYLGVSLVHNTGEPLFAKAGTSKDAETSFYEPSSSQAVEPLSKTSPIRETFPERIIGDMRSNEPSGNATPSSKDAVIVCTCCPKHADTNKEILRQAYFLRSICTDIMTQITDMRCNKNLEPVPDEQSIFRLFNFPLKTEEELVNFNTHLKETSNFNLVVQEISRFGGKNCYEFVKRSLDALIDLNLAKEYSWLGRRDKKCFCGFETATLIIKSSERGGIPGTTKEVEVAIQMWLKRAPERSKKK